MGHLLYLMFRCDFDVMESLKNLEELGEALEELGEALVSSSCVQHTADSFNYSFFYFAEVNSQGGVQSSLTS